MKSKKYIAGLIAAVMVTVPVLKFSEKTLDSEFAASAEVEYDEAELDLGSVYLADDDDEAEDFVVWACGRDIRDNPKTEENEAKLYKSYKYEHVGMFSGGKWNVAVTPEDIDTVEKFLALFDSTLRMDKEVSDKVKTIATASISSGTVTVTAGKEAGTVNVWVYEVNKNKDTKKKEIVNDEKNSVVPTFEKVEVRMAAAFPIISEADSFDENGVIKPECSSISTITLLYKNGEDSQDEKTLVLGDKRNTPHEKAKFVGEYKTDSAAAAVEFEGNEITVTPKKAGRITYALTNVQSGKAAKLNVKVIDAFKVTVPSDATVTYKSGREIITVEDGDFVKSGTNLTIKAPGKNIKVNGTVCRNGKHTVKKEAVITAESPEDKD